MSTLRSRSEFRVEFGVGDEKLEQAQGGERGRGRGRGRGEEPGYGEKSNKRSNSGLPGRNGFF